MSRYGTRFVPQLQNASNEAAQKQQQPTLELENAPSTAERDTRRGPRAPQTGPVRHDPR